VSPRAYVPGVIAAVCPTSKSQHLATAKRRQNRRFCRCLKPALTVILSTLPDTDEDTRKADVARGKLRYSRFLKSVGANMAGDAQAALMELVNRAPEE
jgi:hypothetical protein